MKCFEHIFEPSPNELAVGGGEGIGLVTAEPCIMSSLLRRHIIKVRLHTAISRVDFVSWWML